MTRASGDYISILGLRRAIQGELDSDILRKTVDCRQKREKGAA